MTTTEPDDGPIGEVPPAVVAYETRLDVTRAEVVRLTGERDAALAEVARLDRDLTYANASKERYAASAKSAEARLRGPKITDITFTVEGAHGIDDPLIEDYLDEVHDALESKLGGDVLLSSQGSNDDGETFRSVVAERDAARAEVFYAARDQTLIVRSVDVSARGTYVRIERDGVPLMQGWLHPEAPDAAPQPPHPSEAALNGGSLHDYIREHRPMADAPAAPEGER